MVKNKHFFGKAEDGKIRSITLFVAISIALMMSVGVTMAQTQSSEVAVTRLEAQQECLCAHAVGDGDDPVEMICPMLVEAAQEFIAAHSGSGGYVHEYARAEESGFMTLGLPVGGITAGNELGTVYMQGTYKTSSLPLEVFAQVSPYTWYDQELSEEEMLERAEAIILYCQTGEEPGDWAGGGGGMPFVNAVIACTKAALLAAGIVYEAVKAICFNIFMKGYVALSILQILINFGIESMLSTVHQAWLACKAAYMYLYQF